MLKVRCQAQATVDDKGRLALPAQLRRALADANESSLVLTFNQGALWGWTAADYERFVERPMQSRDPFAADVLDFVHAVLASAQDVEIDGQGRIRVPQMLRDLAHIERDVVINSVLERIEIWSKDAWEARFRQSLDRRANASGMPKGE